MLVTPTKNLAIVPSTTVQLLPNSKNLHQNEHFVKEGHGRPSEIYSNQLRANIETNTPKTISEVKETNFNHSKKYSTFATNWERKHTKNLDQ